MGSAGGTRQINEDGGGEVKVLGCRGGAASVTSSEYRRCSSGGGEAVGRRHARGTASVAVGRLAVGRAGGGGAGGCCRRRKPKKKARTEEDDRRWAEPVGDTWRPVKPRATGRGLGQPFQLLPVGARGSG
jgi:hypothetical protein